MADPAEIRKLYRVPPSEFVAARAALVKRLRAAGRNDDAKAAVKARKPTVSAWALDQVAIDEPQLIERALEAGDALRAATSETLDGDATHLRAATAADAEAAGAVLAAAVGHLPSATADHKERMAATLRAAVLDAEVRAQLLDGVVHADHDPPAFGFETVVATRAPAASRASGRANAAPASDEPPKRKVRRVGTPRSAAPPAPADEVQGRRRTRELARIEAEAAERRRAEEAERARQLARERQQAALDAAAVAARARADELAEAADRAEAAAQAARAEATAAALEAEAAEESAKAGPPD